jgi:hypothetical protein
MTAPGDPLDDVDEAILGQIRAAYELTDPPPADLDERVKFAVRLENADVELARLYENSLAGSSARSAEERIRKITFEGETLTIMVTAVGAGVLRVEGWLAPPGSRRVELRIADPHGDLRGRTHATTADDRGRFVFPEIPSGLAQFAVRQPADMAAGTTVVTPTVML